jgi:hypothetical protein
MAVEASCPTVENLFLDHAMLVRNDVAVQITDSDFYIRKLPKEPWLDGNGYQYSYPVYQRSMVTKAVTDADFFTEFATLSATGDTATNNLIGTGACNLAGHNIDSFGVDIKTVSLKKAAINSPDICLDDFKFQWQVLDQIKNVTRVLAENSKWVWSQTYQTESINAGLNKVTAMSSPNIDTFFDPSNPPTSPLTFGLLEEIHQELGYAGGTLHPTARMDDGTAVYTAVGSTYTFNLLKRQSANQRNDFRYYSNSEPGILVSEIGLGGKIYHGFKFEAVQFPPRYDIVGGPAYERQYPFSSEDATRGMKWNVGSNYKGAEFEDTNVYHEDVMKVLIPKPQGNIGALTYQKEFSWAGEFVWRNIPDRQCNIDGNIGFFRALFAYGIKLERPELGFTVRHLRCDPDLDLREGCATDS